MQPTLILLMLVNIINNNNKKITEFLYLRRQNHLGRAEKRIKWNFQAYYKIMSTFKNTKHKRTDDTMTCLWIFIYSQKQRS